MNESYFEPILKKYPADIIAEAKERQQKREKERLQKMWHEHPDVIEMLNANAIFRDLNISGNYPKTTFLFRILFPTSTNIRLNIFKQYENTSHILDSSTTMMEATQPETAELLQDFRYILSKKKYVVQIARRLKREEDEEESICYGEGYESPESQTLRHVRSLRFLIFNCLSGPRECPAKEEALYLLAALAMHTSDALKYSDGQLFSQVIEIFTESFDAVDRHIIDRRIAQEKYDNIAMMASYKRDSKKYIPPCFTFQRYAHEGFWAYHRFRNLSLYTAAFMLHYWRRESLIKQLIQCCGQTRTITRLHLLRMLQVVLRYWNPPESPRFGVEVYRQMRALYEARTSPAFYEFHESEEILTSCMVRVRQLMDESVIEQILQRREAWRGLAKCISFTWSDL